MKNSISGLFVLLLAFSLTAFVYVNWNNPPKEQPKAGCNTSVFTNDFSQPVYQPPVINLLYQVDSRFIARITKASLRKAKTVADIVPEQAEWSNISFQDMKVAVLQQDGEEIQELGENGILNAAQTELLQSLDYSSNFYLYGTGYRKPGEQMKCKAEGSQAFAYYFTVIPETEAEYQDGEEALISYLKENSKTAVTVIVEDQLKPCRIHFTVTKTGELADVFLDSTSGFSSVDEALVELVQKLPGTWIPARNVNGEAVDQQLVFFFGRQGC